MLSEQSAGVRRASRSDYLKVRRLRYHVRRWGEERAPKLMLLHGWNDASASFQFFVQPLLPHFQVLAPDLRGFGATEWAPDGYWFADYLGDLDALFDHYAGGEPMVLAGHSLGSQIVTLYAGLRPERVSRLIGLDGPFMIEDDPSRPPGRYLDWLNGLRVPYTQRTYPDFEEFARRIRRLYPRLGAERANFAARCWSRTDANGNTALRADPRHRAPFPTGYRLSDSEAIWRCITAPTLFVDAGDSELKARLGAKELLRRRNLIGDYRERVVEGSGHMLHLEKPEAAAAAMLEFLVGR